MSGVTTRGEARALIQRAFGSALVDIDPKVAMKRALKLHNNSLGLRSERARVPAAGFIVIAIGKAAAPMAAAAAEELDCHIRAGVILAKDGHVAGAPTGFEVFEARHPIPDERGVTAARRILSVVADLNADDTVIALISGGGSALFESPKPPVTLADLQVTTELILKAGAPIQDLNAVRSELSEVKGGGLRRAIGDARCVTLILSDVLSNDLGVIASGPTIHRTPDPDYARRVINKYALWDRMPTAVRTVLGANRNERNLASSSIRNDDICEIIGDNAHLQLALQTRFDRERLVTTCSTEAHEGEARIVGREFVECCLGASSKVDVVIGGGETTVTVHGNGEGGRNTEFALSAALELDARNVDWVIASLASDGQDGTIDAAGAIVDRDTIRRANALGLDAGNTLDANDSGGYFRRTGELVVPGPTGTNVNDVYVGVRVREWQQ